MTISVESLSEVVLGLQDSPPEISVVMPCLNEAETLPVCIEKLQRTFRDHGIRGEVIVADNGSSDGSVTIADRMGARVISVETKGYGSALMGGIAAARGEYVMMGDADDSYDFTSVPAFLAQLRQGFDLVMGNRFKGGIAPDAMPMLHRYLGNPVLTLVGRLFFNAPCGDFHCGLRGFRKDAYERMGLRTTGMEFATEMIVKATLLHMRISEIPTTLAVDGRSRPPHLRTWRDGWRHLRFMLLYSPRWLFLYPGALLFLAGTIVGIWLLAGPKAIGDITFDVDTLLYAAMAILVGFQAIAFATFTKVFAISEGLLPEDPRMTRLFRFITLEVGLVVGGVLMAIGLAATLYAVRVWGMHHFGPLDPTQILRVVIPAALSLTLGFQVILSSFFLSVLGLRRRLGL
jgi:glycosyltransferase involved in cell wall biosynthesis